MRRRQACELKTIIRANDLLPRQLPSRNFRELDSVTLFSCLKNACVGRCGEIEWIIPGGEWPLAGFTREHAEPLVMSIAIRSPQK